MNDIRGGECYYGEGGRDQDSYMVSYLTINYLLLRVSQGEYKASFRTGNYLM